MLPHHHRNTLSVIKFTLMIVDHSFCRCWGNEVRLKARIAVKYSPPDQKFVEVTVSTSRDGLPIGCAIREDRSAW
jgi:hypothetical protein